MTNTVCILAGGKSSRIGQNIQKALLPINNMAIISHIINKFSMDMQFVIITGYQALETIQYCQTTHTDRDFTFINGGPCAQTLSDPGVSMWECRQYLQEPFYLTTCDCLIDESISETGFDWIGVAKTNQPHQFATVSVENNLVTKWVNKLSSGSNLAYIGLAHIESWKDFWHQPATEKIDYFKNIATMHAKPFTWYDTGTLENYINTKYIFEKRVGHDNN